jgi:hypothetical protein
MALVSSKTNLTQEADEVEMANPIQEQFGQHMIDAFAQFARSDLKTPLELEMSEFEHIDDLALRKHLAEVFYGVRWIYKLGLALLTKDAERAAHVRAQIVDYASISEALLSYCIGHGILNSYFKESDILKYSDVRKTRTIKWIEKDPVQTLRKQNLWWLIRASWELKIIDDSLAEDLQWLRRQRNNVHLQEYSAVGERSFLFHSRRAFSIATATITQTKIWKSSHR